MDLQRLQQLLSNMPGRGGGPAMDAPLPDTAEKIQISSLSLLKMLKHGKCPIAVVNCISAHLIIALFSRTCWCTYGGDGTHAWTVC